MELGKVGSGLDVEAIVKALVDADVAPRTNALDRREKSFQADLTAFGTLKASMDGLDKTLEGLQDGTSFELLKIDAPDEVDVRQTGSPSTGQYTMSVSSLASSQVLASPGFDAATTTIGTGTITIKIGAPTYTSGSSGSYSGFVADSAKTVSVAITSENNTVSGIRDAINASAAEVTASLVVDGTKTRLLITANDSGASTALSISVDDDDGNDLDSDASNTTGLSQLAYNLDSGTFVGNLSEARSSSDAAFTLNGLSLTNSSNSIVGLLDGVDVTLKKTTTGESSFTIEKDLSAIEAKVQDFVDAYNDYQTTLSTLTDYENSAGALAGDSTARRIQNVIRSVTTGEVGLVGNTFTALSDIGVTSDRFGKLSLSSSTFQAALSSSPADLKKFFGGSTISTNLTDNTDSTGMADLLRESIDVYINSSTGMLVSREQSLNSAIDEIADDRLDVLTRMESLEARYTRQFTAMDTLVSQLQGTSDLLSNQMDALKAAANR